MCEVGIYQLLTLSNCAGEITPPGGDWDASAEPAAPGSEFRAEDTSGGGWSSEKSSRGVPGPSPSGENNGGRKSSGWSDAKDDTVPKTAAGWKEDPVPSSSDPWAEPRHKDSESTEKSGWEPTEEKESAPEGGPDWGAISPSVEGWGAGGSGSTAGGGWDQPEAAPGRSFVEFLFLIEEVISCVYSWSSIL